MDLEKLSKQMDLEKLSKQMVEDPTKVDLQAVAEQMVVVAATDALKEYLKAMKVTKKPAAMKAMRKKRRAMKTAAPAAMKAMKTPMKAMKKKKKGGGSFNEYGGEGPEMTKIDVAKQIVTELDVSPMSQRATMLSDGLTFCQLPSEASQAACCIHL